MFFITDIYLFAVASSFHLMLASQAWLVGNGGGGKGPIADDNFDQLTVVSQSAVCFDLSSANQSPRFESSLAANHTSYLTSREYKNIIRTVGRQGQNST